MVLASQMARTGLTRRQMASRAGKRSTWVWVAGVLIVCAAGAAWFWPTHEEAASDRPTESALIAPVKPTPPPTKTGAATAQTSKTPQNNDVLLASLLKPAQPSSVAAAGTPTASSTAAGNTPATPAVPSQQPTPVPNTPSPSTATTSSSTATGSSSALAQATQLIDTGRLVEARAALSRLLTDTRQSLSATDRQAVRDKLTDLNWTLIFSSRVVPGDPLTESHTIQDGEFLAHVAPRYNTTYQLIEYVNGINANRIRLGQKVKVVKGPFHAVVHKSEFRMDLFLPGPDKNWVYIRSFEVGLGEDDSTPVGNWIVRRGGKVANPAWTNPRTGQTYTADDPKNPIGEYWIGLEGADDRTKGLAGYGIHGTIEPDSIGRQMSMGCLRLRPDDIALVYKLLVDGQSTIDVRP